MVKKGQLEVSKMGSPEQGEDRDPNAPTTQHRTGGGTAADKRSHGSQSQQLGRAVGPAAALLLIPSFLAVGVALGAVYGVWLGEVDAGPPPLRGAAFALLPLATALLVGLPLVGAGVGGLELRASLVPAAGETIRHLVYGLALGTLYPALAYPRHAGRRRAARGQPSPGGESVVHQPVAQT